RAGQGIIEVLDDHGDLVDLPGPQRGRDVAVPGGRGRAVEAAVAAVDEDAGGGGRRGGMKEVAAPSRILGDLDPAAEEGARGGGGSRSGRAGPRRGRRARGCS